MDVLILWPISGSAIVAAALFIILIFEMATSGISGDSMEEFAGEYTIYFALIMFFISLAVVLFLYHVSKREKEAIVNTKFSCLSWGLCLFSFLCTAYIWVIASIWNLFECLGMGFFAFMMAFPFTAIIYLLIGVAALVPVFVSGFLMSVKVEGKFFGHLACFVSSAIYCYVMYIFEFFDFLAESWPF